MKGVIKVGVAAAFVLLSSNVYAQSSYVTPLNAGLGNGAVVSCGACHTDGGSKGSATLPMAGTWRSGAHLALTDSDGDGFNNAQEVSGGSTNFNYNSISPFSLAKAVESSTSASVVVVGGIASETVITDATGQIGLTLAAGHTIAGAVSPLVTTFSATIFFNQAVNVGDKVYVVDLVNKTNTLLTSGVVFNANGSVTLSGLAGAQNIVVDRATPVVPAPGPSRGGEEEGLECVAGQISTPLTMVLVMLSLGFFVRRRKD